MLPSPFKAALAAVILISVPVAAWAQPAPSAAPEFTIERRDTLRRTWQLDSAIYGYVGPGDAERLDTYADAYPEDSTARQSLAPVPAEVLDLAVTTARDRAP
jgi:hypothetical protein